MVDYSNYTDEELLKLKLSVEKDISRFNNEQMAFKIAMNSLNCMAQ